METVCIYPSDIHKVTGKSERWGREIIRRIKKKYNKEDHQLVSIEEFCSYTDLDITTVKNCLNAKKTFVSI